MAQRALLSTRTESQISHRARWLPTPQEETWSSRAHEQRTASAWPGHACEQVPGRSCQLAGNGRPCQTAPGVRGDSVTRSAVRQRPGGRERQGGGCVRRRSESSIKAESRQLHLRDEPQNARRRAPPRSGGRLPQTERTGARRTAGGAPRAAGEFAVLI